MITRTLFVLLAFALAGPVHAQKKPAEVTDAEIAKYKATAKGGCMDAGKQKGDPADKADAFCTCLIEYLDKNMTHSEWQRVYVYSMNKQSAEESSVLSPHLTTFRGCSAQMPDAPAAAAPAVTAPAPPPASTGTGLKQSTPGLKLPPPR
jgi:hypothetical protein